MIETERLLLSKITHEDVDLIYDINNPPECTYLYSGVIVSVELCHDIINTWIELHKDSAGIGTFCVEVKENKHKIGIAYLLDFIEPNHVLIGFKIRKAYWSLDYESEIIRGFIEHAERNLDVDALIAKVYQHDKRSLNLFEESQFKVMGPAYGEYELLYKYTLNKNI